MLSRDGGKRRLGAFNVPCLPDCWIAPPQAVPSPTDPAPVVCEVENAAAAVAARAPKATLTTAFALTTRSRSVGGPAPAPAGRRQRPSHLLSRMQQQLRSHDQWIVFDLETTGFSPTADQILEIAAVRVHRDEDDIMEAARDQDDGDRHRHEELPSASGTRARRWFNMTCRLGDDFTIHPCAAHVNGFSAERGPDSTTPAGEAVLRFAEFCLRSDRDGHTTATGSPPQRPPLLIAHNARFDCSFLRQACLREIARLDVDSEAACELPDDAAQQRLDDARRSSRESLQTLLVMLAPPSTAAVAVASPPSCVTLSGATTGVAAAPSDSCGAAAAAAALAAAHHSLCSRGLFLSLFPGSPSSSLEGCHMFLTGNAVARFERRRPCTGGAAVFEDDDDGTVDTTTATAGTNVTGRRQRDDGAAAASQDVTCVHVAKDDVVACRRIVKILAAYLEDLDNDEP